MQQRDVKIIIGRAAAMVPHLDVDIDPPGSGIVKRIAEFHLKRRVRIVPRVRHRHVEIRTISVVIMQAAVVFDAGMVTGCIPALIEFVDGRLTARHLDGADVCAAPQ